MTPRDVIRDGIIKETGVSLATVRADAAIAALTAASVTIVHKDENHGPTVERCAQIADTAAIRTHDCGVHAEAIAEALRALTGGANG